MDGPEMFVGMGLTTVVFAVSVRSLPMIIDRLVDARTAMRTSLHASCRAYRELLGQ